LTTTEPAPSSVTLALAAAPSWLTAIALALVSVRFTVDAVPVTLIVPMSPVTLSVPPPTLNVVLSPTVADGALMLPAVAASVAPVPVLSPPL